MEERERALRLKAILEEAVDAYERSGSRGFYAVLYDNSILSPGECILDDPYYDVEAVSFAISIIEQILGAPWDDDCDDSEDDLWD